jgi:ligand-binding sensor domain-containing protein/DNA-binding CsgD family transcriptional regulator
LLCPLIAGTLLPMRINYVFIFIFSLLSIPIRAQEFTVITSSEGLNSSTVNAIVKDSDGLIWIGTKAGLYKYNEGYAEEVLIANRQINNIKSLLFTSDSILLIGFNDGDLVSFDTESRLTIEDSRIPSPEIEFPIVSLFEDDEGSIWLGSIGNGVKQLKVNSHNWVDINPVDSSIHISACFDFAQQGNTLWLATSGNEIHFYSYSKNQVYRLESLGYNINSFRKSVDVHENKVVFSIESLGALELSEKGNILHPFPCRDAVYFNNELWISTDGGGIVQFSENKYNHFSKNDYNTSLITDQYYNFFKDDSFLWLGSYNGGALVISGNTPVIRKIHVPSRRNLGAINSVISMHRLDSLVLIGFDGEGSFNFDGSKIVPFTNHDISKTSQIITSILVDTNSNNVWMGSYSEGISIYDFKGRHKRTIRPYLGSSLGLIHGGIWSLEQGFGDTIYVGTSEGFQYWDGRRFRLIQNEGWIQKKEVVNDIIHNSSGTWFARGKEVVHLKGRSIQTKVFPGNVLDLNEFGDSLIVSTEGFGLYILNQRDYTSISLAHEDISTSYATVTLVDKIIVAGNDGLYDIVFRDGMTVTRQLATIEELGILEFNRKTLVEFKEGLILGGTKGLYFYDLNAEPQEFPNGFIIDRILLDDDVYHPIPKRTNSSEDISHIDIDVDHNSIHFDFELLNLFKKIDKSIQYILDGTVVSVNKQNRSFSVANLAPGKHELTIQLVSEEGAVLSSRRFSINKKVKFYQYPAFQFLILISLLVLISLVLVINLQKRKREIRIKLLETEKDLLDSRASESKALLDKRNIELEFQLLKTSNRIEILRDFKVKFTQILRQSSTSSNIESDLRDLHRTIDRELKNETYWDSLQDKYYRINDDVISIFKSEYPQLTKGDLDFVLLLRKNLSSKEIAALLNITVYAVRKRKYRIKQKLNLKSEEDLLSHFKSLENQ